MSIERIVQIHIATLTIIGAVLLGMGQGSPVLPLLAIFAAVTSIVFTDYLQWFHVNRVVANLAALGALFLSLDEFFQGDSRIKLLAIANLLVYLQLLLFYQRKHDRLYGQLAVLSLLQVIVSAVLNVGFEFGLLLVAYAVVAVSTMVFFFVHREFAKVTRAPTGSGQRTKADPLPDAGHGLLRWRPRVRSMTSSLRLGRQVIGWGLLRQTVTLAVATLMFTFVLFFFAPRTNSMARHAGRSRTMHVVGFSEEVRLDELGSVLESGEPVMRVSFVEIPQMRSYRVYGDPYFRGVILTDYIADDGVPRWRQCRAAPPESELRSSTRNSSFLYPPPKLRNLVRQDVTLRPIDSAVLFGVFPLYRVDRTPSNILYHASSGLVYDKTFKQKKRVQDLRYSVATTAFRGGLQLDVTPHRNRLVQPGDAVLDWELQRLAQFDEHRFPTLKRIADEIAQQRQAAGRSRAELARALRDHFLRQGAYTYSLDFTRTRRRPGIDPIEDFVANHQTGHCEYFASALVMMLRSQGIPARMVIGYHGGEYNTLGDYYQVVQSNAHAWVEAHLDRAEAEKELPEGSDISPAGGWLRLDATPGASKDRARQVERGMMDVVDDVLDYARLMWTDYIMEMTAKRQRENIYEPVADSANVESWEAFAEQLSLNREAAVRGLRGFWFSWRGAVFAISLAILGITYFQRSRRRRKKASPVARAVQRFTRRLGSASLAIVGQRGRSAVDFYLQFEKTLNRAGIERQTAETQAEFAKRALERLGHALPEKAFELPVGRIVDAFYRVRFGRCILSAEELVSLQQTLERFRNTVESVTKKSGALDRTEAVM